MSVVHPDLEHLEPERVGYISSSCQHGLIFFFWFLLDPVMLSSDIHPFMADFVCIYTHIKCIPDLWLMSLPLVFSVFGLK